MPYLAPTGGRNLRRLGFSPRPGCGWVAGLVIADGQGEGGETGQWLPNAEPWTLDEATLTRSFPTGVRKSVPRPFALGAVHRLELLDRDVAQLGSALRSGRRGRRFESCHPDFKLNIKMVGDASLLYRPHKSHDSELLQRNQSASRNFNHLPNNKLESQDSLGVRSDIPVVPARNIFTNPIETIARKKLE